jgi:3-phenylpropionate/cinnamic acid dioxygenase small subunit
MTTLVTTSVAADATAAVATTPVAAPAALAARVVLPADLRFEIEDLYTAYANTLDQARYKEWPEYFVEDALYRIVPRENYVRGLPIAVMHCESKGMIQDRAYAVEELNMVQPRVLRHFVSGITVESAEADRFNVSANFLVVQTLFEEMTEIVMAGRYVDEIVRKDGRLLFQTRLCVYDSALIPTSLVAPI